MKIAFVLNEFPKLSETFIVNQIVGLIERGHAVEIFAYQKGDDPAHPLVEQYQLIHRTQYLNIPTSFKKRVPVVAKIILKLIDACAYLIAYCQFDVDACIVGSDLPGIALNPRSRSSSDRLNLKMRPLEQRPRSYAERSRFDGELA